MIRRPRQPRQRGFSLIELMVALVVSLLLLAGILQILLSNRASFGAQQTLAGLQENSRLASFVIENAVAHAGYRTPLEIDTTAYDQIFPSATNNGFSFAADAVVAAQKGGQQDTDGNDAVSLRFRGAGDVHDCLGNTIGSPTTDPTGAELSLYVAYSSASDSDALYCRSDASANPEPLVDNVERFRVRYGLDTSGDGSVDAYTDTLTTDQQSKVRSLRLQLLLATADNVLPADTQQTFTFADGSSVTSNDRHARQMVDQTVALRNLLQ